MRRIFGIVCLFACVLVGGCALEHEPFSCGSGEAYRTGDPDIRPATVSPGGYRHC